MNNKGTMISFQLTRLWQVRVQSKGQSAEQRSECREKVRVQSEGQSAEGRSECRVKVRVQREGQSAEWRSECRAKVRVQSEGQSAEWRSGLQSYGQTAELRSCDKHNVISHVIISTKSQVASATSIWVRNLQPMKWVASATWSGSVADLHSSWPQACSISWELELVLELFHGIYIMVVLL